MNCPVLLHVKDGKGLRDTEKVLETNSGEIPLVLNKHQKK